MNFSLFRRRARSFEPMEITPSDAARALSLPHRLADRERIRERTAQLAAGIKRGEIAQLGWRA